MIALNTQEKLDLVLNALEDGEIVLDSREIAEYRATHPKTSAKEAVLA